MLRLLAFLQEQIQMSLLAYAPGCNHISSPHKDHRVHSRYNHKLTTNARQGIGARVAMQSDPFLTKGNSVPRSILIYNGFGKPLSLIVSLHTRNSDQQQSDKVLTICFSNVDTATNGSSSIQDCDIFHIHLMEHLFNFSSCHSTVFFQHYKQCQPRLQASVCPQLLPQTQEI